MGQGLFLDSWLGTHTSIMSQDVSDIHGQQADFGSGEEMASFFKGWFSEKKGKAPFLVPWKALPKVKRIVFKENMPSKSYSDTLKISEKP